MNVFDEFFTEIVKSVFTMTFTGSIVSILLFAIKPIIKDKLPKSFQYYMWLPVIISLILPLSKIVVIPAPSSPATSVRSMNDVVRWVSDTAFEQPVNFALVPQAGSEQESLQTTAYSANVGAILFILWQSGMVLVLGFKIICYVLYVRRLKKFNMSAEQQETELLNKLSGSKKTPRLYKNPMVATPVLIGVLRPEVILPDKKYEETKLQGILLHEITHMRKHDIAVKWLLILVGALHWFNPIIYFVLKEINKACELACDESVIKKFDIDGKQHYGDALIMVAADSMRKIPISITMVENKKNLKERLDAIMKHKEFPKKTIFLSCILLVIIVCGTLYLGISRSSTDPEFQSLQAETVVNNLGKNKDVILVEFNVTDEGDQSGRITEDFIYNDVPVEINFEFMNDKLFRVRYNFGTEAESALLFADELMSTFEEKYGESDTYPTMPDRIEGLTLENYLKDDIAQYKEYWIDSGVTFDGMVPEEYQASRRIDLGIGMYRYPFEEVQTVVYVGGIVNDTNTRKLN